MGHARGFTRAFMDLAKSPLAKGFCEGPSSKALLYL